MRRVAYFGYGVLCYVMFLAVFAYAVGFLANAFVPKSIDAPAASLSAPAAAAVNVLLLGLFGVQHSVMARPRFKRWLTRFVPAPIERSTYVLASNLALVLLMWLWQPIGRVVWDVADPAARAAVWGVFAAGWLLVVGSTLLLNHFDLFGLRQVWLHLRGQEYRHLPFRVPLLYRNVRHPLYVGWLVTFWVTPTMTVGHALFAGVCLAYILVAIRLEERDLVEHHGPAYADYRRQVPMLVPALTRRYRESEATAPAAGVAAS